MSIHDPSPSFEFDTISLTTPVHITGGAHFSKIMTNKTPLYIQTPKCFTKNGIVGSGRKMYTDLIFTNENEEIIQWMEALESTIRRKIYENREKWFDTEMSEDDIEGCFSPMVKLFRSGKQYCVRVNINSKPDAKPLKIYDEDEVTVEASQINEKTPLIAILEIQGVRCTSRSFCIDIEMKQLMVMKPGDLFDSFVITKGRGTKAESNQTPLPASSTPSLGKYDNQESKNEQTNNVIQESSIAEAIVKEPISMMIEEQEFAQDLAPSSLKHLSQDLAPSLLKDLSADLSPSLSPDLSPSLSPSLSPDLSPSFSQDLVNNSLSDPIIITTDDDSDYLGLKSTNDIEEVDFDVNQIAESDTFQLKDKKEVYYEMYREALQKAKTAKAMALTSFMEARRIKNLYMLNDINDSDEESDLDDLDDLSDDE
jgi:hypothetical protein